MELTWCLGEIGRHEESLAAARRALELDPVDVGALGNLAAALMKTGCLDEAEETVRSALELSPEDAINNTLLKQIQGQRRGRVD